jgi:signal transduction histidine kinase
MQAEPKETRPLLVRIFLARLVWLCILPLIALALCMAVVHVRTLQSQRSRQAADLAHNFAVAIDRNLGARIAGLQLLAGSPLVDDPRRRPELYQEAQVYRHAFGGHVILADTAMQMLFNTRVPLGEPLTKLPKPGGHAAAPEALETGRPSVGDAFFGPVAKAPLVAVAVPVIRDGATRFLLLSTIETRHFQERLELLSLPVGWTLTLHDSRRQVIARRGPPGDTAVPQVPTDGDAKGRFTAPSSVAPWSVALEIPPDIYRAPVVTAAVFLGLAIAMVALLSVVGGRLAARRLASAVSSLADGKAPTPTGRTPLAEIEAVRRMLTEAAASRAATEKSIRRHSERLENLHRIDRAILAAIDSPDAIAETALIHLRGMLQGQRASIGLFDFANHRVRVFAAEADGEDIVRKGEDLAEGAYGNLETLRQSRMEIVEDTACGAAPPGPAHLPQAEGIGAFLNAPLFSSQGLVGALNIGWQQPRRISAEEVEIAQEVADQVAIAIDQARLLQETRRHAAELEQRVTERTEQLQAANKELEAFSYSVSHDLRAPLRAVDGYVRILVEEFGQHLDIEGRRICKVIGDSAKTMGKLIDDMLAFSRVGRSAMQPSLVDMATLARSIFFEVTTAEARERIEFKVGLLPAALVDPTLIRQVLSNLLSNAVKYSSKIERAAITVEASHKGGETAYCVRDNGAGFDMRYKDKLFGVFQRLHSAREFEGTGVGLAIVQRIVHRHGGRVWADGETGKGAAFYFTLTAAEAAERIAVSSI